MFELLTLHTKPMSVVIPLCPSPRSSPQTSPVCSPSTSLGSSRDNSPRLTRSSPHTAHSSPALRRSPRLKSLPPSPVSSQDDEEMVGTEREIDDEDDEDNEDEADDDDNLINTSYLSPAFRTPSRLRRPPEKKRSALGEPVMKRPMLSLHTPGVYLSSPLLLSSQSSSGRKRKSVQSKEDFQQKPLSGDSATNLGEPLDLDRQYLSQSVSESKSSIDLDLDESPFLCRQKGRGNTSAQVVDLEEESIPLVKKPLVIDLMDVSGDVCPLKKKPMLERSPSVSVELPGSGINEKKRRWKPLSPQDTEVIQPPRSVVGSLLDSAVEGRLLELSLVAGCRTLEMSTVISKLNSGGELVVDSFQRFLNNGFWLDDLGIDFFASFLCSESTRGSCHWISWALMNSPHLNRPRRSKKVENNPSPLIIIAPVNWSSTHWGLVGYSVTIQEYWFFDATKTYMLSNQHIKCFHSCCESVFPSLLPELPPDPDSVKPYTPQTQTDGWSCGLRSLYFICTCCETALLPPDPPVSAMRSHLLQRWSSSPSLWIHSSLTAPDPRTQPVSLENI